VRRLSPRRTVILTVVPFGPRILFATCEMSSPLTLLPFTATITSPGCTPAFAAGEPSIGATMTVLPSFCSSCIPTPTYFPESPCLLLLTSSGVRKRVCPLSPKVFSIAWMAA
jgi:hypothetical protein